MDSDQIAHSDIPRATGKGRSPRQLLIGGVVALLVIAGVAVVGAQATGSRSGSTYSGLTCSKSGDQYTRFTSTSGFTSVTYSWYDVNNVLLQDLYLGGSGGSYQTITPTNAHRVVAILTPTTSSSTAKAACS